uniref:Phospholipase A2 n=1 Tax=Gopherus evgoodei TaxID=1825980 RepID=A0A8C4VZT6_9SAUR
MIKQVTGKNALWNYSKYGCYCGSGGKGTPKDGTDRCCQLHDCCYERLEDHGCNAKLNIYSYFYLSERIYCGDWCKRNICECDKAAALCMKRNLRSYNKKYRFYSNIKCTGRKPRC